MSVRQSKESELRYIKRKNLEQEAKVIGNYYRDIIRSFGTDVMYQKLNTSLFENYKQNIDRNLILQRAYGYQLDPDYTCSADMISYIEVDQDVFQLNKYGLNPNGTDVSFYFDSIDFACALAEKLGQYEEHLIDDIDVCCEVPDCDSASTSAMAFPFKLGIGRPIEFHSRIVSGKLSAEIDSYEYGVKQTIACDPYEHSDGKVEFPSNPYLYKSLLHHQESKGQLDFSLKLDFVVDKVIVGKSPDGKELYKSILHGKIHGGVLFYNLSKIGKYLDLIHPEVGDLVTIDFPDDANKEKYEITDCYEKSLQSDGISPLLHKYVWKCKARRYVNSYDNTVPENEADKRKQEKIDLDTKLDEEVAKKISFYDGDEDTMYGGYDGQDIIHDADTKKVPEADTMVHIDAETLFDIVRFKCGSRLATDGYDLMFFTAKGIVSKLTLSEAKSICNDTYFESGLKFLRASADTLSFVNIEGQTFFIADELADVPQEVILHLSSLYGKAVDTDPKEQKVYRDFYCFKTTRTILWATEDSLFCRFQNGSVHELA